MAKKYSVKKETLDKINQLFAYRRLTNLLKAAKLDADKNFVADIINVQYHIYMLDGYLESQWALDKGELKKLWEAITTSLRAMNLDDKQVSALVKEIKA